ncbi:excalibur calcium-binding domain-containing protein [Prauserella cavernicola]|uniref:Excalibur calcium-binding domain-containing protein n=1 Tax=Prauserella cavernicola TaxID=2800127 RepID=A0A934V3J0_9PSEU|nr:excalibur calcium-binding domain-containing protein [Prauserella cavernicola]MBK1784407.1 excalibur calcium-binding domain-containing protein [Prauserella cavernicola]
MSVKRRLMVFISAFALAGMACTGIATAEAQTDYNCSDFETWEEAKKVFDSLPGDPYDLDRDGNGIPCESLPGAPDDDPGTPPPSPEPPVEEPPAEQPPATQPPAEQPPATQAPVADKNCDDFASQSDAQAALEQDPSDPHNLDGDNDGEACESHFGSASTGDDDQQVAVHPVGGVATGGTGDNEDGSGLVALGALTLVGAGAVFAARRRVQA